jgi:hypothetical protein
MGDLYVGSTGNPVFEVRPAGDDGQREETEHGSMNSREGTTTCQNMGRFGELNFLSAF